MEIIKVKMTKDQDGSPDGVTIREYKKGETVDLPKPLADAFCDDLEVAKRVAKKVAKPAETVAEKVAETPEEPKAPANKVVVEGSTKAG